MKKLLILPILLILGGCTVAPPCVQYEDYEALVTAIYYQPTSRGVSESWTVITDKQNKDIFFEAPTYVVGDKITKSKCIQYKY